MEGFTKARKPLRAQMTRVIKEIAELLTKNPVDNKALKVAGDILEKTNTDLEVWDAKILEQLIKDNASDEVFEDESKSKEKYKRLYFNGWSDLEQSRVSANEETASVLGSTSEDKKRKFNLPDVKLKTFGGNLKEWLGWWSQFEKIHLDENLHATDKFWYLSQAMENGSEAKEIVDSYPQSEVNYQKAIDALKDTFGRSDLLLQVYVRELLTLVISNATNGNKLPLSQFHLRLESHLRCLEELDLDKADPATWLYPLVESTLSDDLMRAWQRSSLSSEDGSKLDPPKSRLDYLREFMRKEVQCDQQLHLARQGFQSKPMAPSTAIGKSHPKARWASRKEDAGFPTAAGLLNQQTSGCVFCGKSHESEKCFKAQKMSLDEKQKLVMDKFVCFQCLIKGHLRRDCRKQVKCTGCGGSHYRVMCRDLDSSGRIGGGGSNSDRNMGLFKPMPKKRRLEDQAKESQPNDQVSNIRTFHQSSNQCSGEILLNTLKVNVMDGNGNLFTVKLVGDSGSQRSYVNSKTREKGNGVWIRDEWLQNVLFGGDVTLPKRYAKHEVTVFGLDGGSMVLQLLEKETITGQLSGVPNGPWIQELASYNISLSDVMDEFTSADILIGNDYWGAIRTGRMIKLTCGLTADETVFGWTLGGPLPTTSSNMVVTTMTVCSQRIENLWSLEALGIRDPVEVLSLHESERAAIAQFESTVQRDHDGRYVVSLPWKNGNFELPSNRRIAEQRLRNTTYKLEKNDKLVDYHNVFLGWEKEGLVKRMDGGLLNGHFIPHRPVFKESLTTPVRPVYDASCRQGRKPSLNDCLFKGPNLMELIPVMVLRFAENKVGVSSDIRKAFQMIAVIEHDQQFQRFLWWENLECKRMVVYQHKRVVFGVTSSPFLLGAVLQHLVRLVEDSLLAEKLRSSFYVDNLLTSVSSLSEYERLRVEATKVLAGARMELRQWASTVLDGNSSEVRILSDEELVGSETFYDGENMPVLGLMWNRERDTLSCVIKRFSFDMVTKRTILSVVAQVFDPMGYLCPVMVLPKMLVQEAWALKLGWDTKVPHDAEIRFLKWYGELVQLNTVEVPRFCQIDGATWREVHVFVDSSMDAMASVAFLRTESCGAVAVQFLLAKSRLTPVKKPTIPRAELISCVIGVRLACCIQEAWKMGMENFVFWSDSTTALTWIRKNGDWGVFVRNRVREILNSTRSEQWHHVPGLLNPADLPSRGCRAGNLLVSKWWEGPKWLCGPRTKFPNSEPAVNEAEVLCEQLKSVAGMVSIPVTSPRFSSYRRNVAVWGWVLRFLDGCRKVKMNSGCFLSIGQLRRAEKIVIGRIQKESFPKDCLEVGGIVVCKDDEGLLRVKTRLGNRKDTLDFKYPLLLPKSHPLVDLLVLDFHRYHGHGGVQFLVSKLREKYWIVNSRRVVRKVVRKCVQCTRHTAKHFEVDPAALPAGRVEDSSPFLTTGVDLAGPLFLKNGEKAWVVLYTCAVYRAVHLDVVTSLSTEAFIRSLERFISTFGRPNTVYSDNGTNFVGAVNLFKRVDWKEVERKCDTQQIHWIFNPPTAAWWGGWWERLVRSVKDLLKRMLGRSRLTLDELRTCLAGVAATINDRPLTVVSEDSNDLMPLTPAMFLKPQQMCHFPELSGVEFLQKSYARMKKMQQLLQHRFRKEYLGLLVTKSGKKQQVSIAKGDVVLVGADNRKRFEWPLGVVEDLFPGKDGVTRVAKVKTANGFLLRPLQRLFPLEISHLQEKQLGKPDKTPVDRQEVQEAGRVPLEVKTRRGRISRKPVRYGQWFHLVKNAAGRMQ